MTTKKKTKRVYRGLAPSPEEIATMRRLGYASPAELSARAKAAGLSVSVSALYAWMRDEKLPDVSGNPERPPSLKRNGKRWILVESFEKKTALPAAAS